MTWQKKLIFSTIRSKIFQSIGLKFKFQNVEKAKCLLCPIIMSCRGQSTSGLWTHLKTKHKNEHELRH
jgi:hypothetical protein